MDFAKSNGVEMRLATQNDFEQIWNIIEDAKKMMNESGRSQWNKTYPSQMHINEDIALNSAYVLCRGEILIAYGVVVLNGEPEYENLQSGKWNAHGNYYVVHRLAVAERFRGMGFAMLYLKNVEYMCVRNNVKSIRIDTKYDNQNMLDILRILGYSYCGRIVYPINGERLAYDKVVI